MSIREEEIRVLIPDGLRQYPIKLVTDKSIEKVKEEPIQPIVVNIGWINLIKLWIKENLITETINAQKGVVMQNKMWYASKTLWVNILTIAWQFGAPVLGLPVLSAELTITLLGVINLILRVVTKQPIDITKSE